MATVLIAEPAHLPTLKSRTELGEIIAFADADVLQALEAITSLRPAIVALEKSFADTSRGSALITRIKADPSLKGCEIRLVLHEGGSEAVAPPPEAPLATVATIETPAPLDYRGTRRAERFAIARGVQVFVEGNAVQLINMSSVGVQVVSATSLKPNQRVRLTLTGQQGAPRLRAQVAWASFELPMGVASYRAGIEILDGADHGAINKFIKKHKA